MSQARPDTQRCGETSVRTAFQSFPPGLTKPAKGESADLNDLWSRCIQESATGDALVLYREDDDTLKGAWVELGAALAANRPVYAVGIESFTISNFSGIVPPKYDSKSS